MKRRKRRVNRKRLFLIFGIVLIILIVILSRYNKKEIIYQEEEKTIEEKEKIYTLDMVMVGDVLIHDRLYKDAYDGSKYDFKKYFTYIKDNIKEYDLAYYNQETILGGTSIGLSSYPSFNSPQEVGDAMIDMGFNLVSLATNHTLDRGKKAIISSREYWNKKDGVYAFGSYTSYEEKNNIENMIHTKNNISYGILNYTYGTNGIKVPNGEEYLVNLWDDTSNYEEYKKKVISDINNIRDKVDVLMVAMHWGREYNHTPREFERNTAKFLADNGVDIIIGTHPHVIQPIEWIDDTLVFYSLGNFISAQTSNSCNNYKCFIGLMSSLTITKTVKEDNIDIKIDNINNDLVYTYHNNYKDYQVIPFSNPIIKNYLENYSQIYNNYAKIIDNEDRRINTVPLFS